MTKWMPPKPKFSSTFTSGISICRHMDVCREFDEWYATEIAPLFENAVWVYGQKTEEREMCGFDERPFDNDTHKALLIKIEPIKEESAEDILKEFISVFGELKQRAKVYLERNK